MNIKTLIAFALLILRLTNVATEVPEEFIVSLPLDEWRKIILVRRSKKGNVIHEIADTYSQILGNRFNSGNKMCVVVFDKKNIVQPKDLVGSSKSYFRVYGNCCGSGCSAKYSFTVKKPPLEGEQNIDITVRKTSGEIKHFVGEKVKRPARGEERQKLKAELKNELASVHRRKAFKNADVEELQLGNYNFVKSLSVFNNIRREANQEDDFHNDVILDLLMTYLHQQKIADPDKKFEANIRRISLVPFWVVLFCDESKKFLRASQLRGKSTLIFDATGTLPKNLPTPLDQGDILYYAVVAPGEPGNPPVPILEFYCGKQNVDSIQYGLATFFSEYKLQYNIRENNCGVSHIEVDFSKTMLAAVIKVFTGGNVEDYLSRIWIKMLDDEVEPMQFAVHVCRVHSLRFFKAKVQELFPKKNSPDEIRAFYMQWFYGFIKLRDIWSYHRRITELFTVAGSRYKTPAVQKVIEGIATRTTREGVPPWQDYTMEGVTRRSPFWLKSPFGHYANSVAEFVTAADNVSRKRVTSGEYAFEENSYHSPELFDYMLVHVFPYAPLLSYAIFTCSNHSINEDTTNKVEYWMKILKRDHFKNARRIKISRLVRQHVGITAGGLKQALGCLPSKKYQDAQKDFDLAKANMEKDMSLLEWEKVELSDSDSEPDEQKLEETEDIVSTKRSRQKSADNKSENQKPKTKKTKTQLFPPDPEKTKEVFKKRSKPKETQPTMGSLQLMPLLPWGLKIKANNIVSILKNTCNFDCTIQILYYLYNHTEEGRKFFQDQKINEAHLIGYIEEILNNIEQDNFSEAKRIWIQNILNLPLQKTMDLFEEERVHALEPMHNILSKITERRKCMNEDCPDSGKPTEKVISTLVLRVENQENFHQILDKGIIKETYCKKCYGDLYLSYHWPECGPPDVLVYTCEGLRKIYKKRVLVSQEVRAKESEIVQHCSLLGIKYNVVAYTLYSGAHYTGVLWTHTQRLFYDGVVKPLKLSNREMCDTLAISTVWLLKENQNR